MSWLDPRTGLLAAGVPLPPRRPPGLGQDPNDLPGPRTMPARPPQGDDYFAWKKKMYPYGMGVGEGEIAPVGPEQKNIHQLNAVLNPHPSTLYQGLEDVNAIPKYPMPSEYVPERPIPLGELQRRWGVPRLEDL